MLATTLPLILRWPANFAALWLLMAALMALVLFLERRAAGRSFEIDQEPDERVGDGRRVGGRRLHS